MKEIPVILVHAWVHLSYVHYGASIRLNKGCAPLFPLSPEQRPLTWTHTAPMELNREELHAEETPCSLYSMETWRYKHLVCVCGGGAWSVTNIHRGGAGEGVNVWCSCSDVVRLMTFIPLLEPAGAGKHGCYGKSAPGASEKSRDTDARIFTHDTTHYHQVGRVEWPGSRGGPAACGPAWFIGQAGRFTRSSPC